MFEHQKTRYDNNSLQTFKALICLFIFESIGFFLGPSPWIWLKSDKQWQKAHQEQFDTKILEYFSLRLFSDQEQRVEILSDQKDEVLPISLFAHTYQKQKRFWAYPLQAKLKEHDIILGEKGLIGRIGKARGSLWEVYPLCAQGMKMTLMSQRDGLPLLFEGQGLYFTGVDNTSSVQVGDLLYTLSSDSHYPSQYPVAQVVEAVSQDHQGCLIKAKPLDCLTNYHYARAYRSSAQIEQILELKR